MLIMFPCIYFLFVLKIFINRVNSIWHANFILVEHYAAFKNYACDLQERINYYATKLFIGNIVNRIETNVSN